MIASEGLVVGLYDRGEGTPNKILDIGNPKILKSGIWSPYLVNMRPALSFDSRSEMPIDDQIGVRAELLDTFDEALLAAEAIVFPDNDEEIFHIYGAPEAGTPLASAIALTSERSLLWGRVGGEKDYGKHQKLEGTYQEGETVAIADDVVTDAATKIEAQGNILAAGLIPLVVVVGFDRQQGGREEIEAAGMQLTASMVAIDAFEALAANKRITQAQFDFLKEYTLGPKIFEEPPDHPWKAK